MLINSQVLALIEQKDRETIDRLTKTLHKKLKKSFSCRKDFIDDKDLRYKKLRGDFEFIIISLPKAERVLSTLKGISEGSIASQDKTVLGIINLAAADMAVNASVILAADSYINLRIALEVEMIGRPYRLLESQPVTNLSPLVSDQLLTEQLDLYLANRYENPHKRPALTKALITLYRCCHQLLAVVNSILHSENADEIFTCHCNIYKAMIDLYSSSYFVAILLKSL